MKKKFLLMATAITVLNATAQNVGIGTTTPNPSAVLDVSSTNKGLLLPRMSTTQRNAIVSPAVGLTILNTDDLCTDIYDGAKWIKNCGFKQGDSVVVPANNWIQKANFGGAARNGAVGFSIGNKGYIGTGFDGSYKNDFWEFDPSTNIWAQKANFGGTARIGAVGFSIGNKGYIGTGIGITGQKKEDFWAYDPATNSWDQKNDFGGTARDGAFGFSIGNKGYIGTGYDGSYKNDFWEYDPTTNTWTQKANFGGGARDRAVGFSIGNKGYIGTGFDVMSRTNDFWEYDPGAPGSLGTWIQKANFGGTARTNAVGFSIGNKGYVGTGSNGGNTNDFWEFDPGAPGSPGTWIQKTNFGGTARFSAVGFSIGNKGYAGTGIDGGYTSDFWEYNPLPYKVASYSTVSNTLLQSNISDGIWTKTVLKEIIASGNKFLITKDGNVGIGINSPHAPLQFQNTGANRKIVLFESADNDHQFYGLGIGPNTMNYQVSAPGANHIFYAGAGATASTELMRIAGNGNVGIGTSGPSNKLSVTGNADFTGNVGIGMTNPNAPLQFANTGANRKIVLFESVNNDHEFYGFGIRPNAMSYQVSAPGANHIFYAGAGATASTELMRIAGNGNVGIGTTTPNALLQLANTIVNRKIVLYDVNNNDHQYYGLGINGSTLRYQIDNTGSSHKFYAGTSTTTSDLLFEVNGLGNAWLKGTLVEASDMRLKKNIQPLSGTISKINQLNGYSYNWKDDNADPSIQIGLLAQEIQKVYPQLVKENEKGTLSVNYMGMVPVLLEAIKEQQQQIEELKQLVNQLIKKSK
jgi:hypothetical protein